MDNDPGNVVIDPDERFAGVDRPGIKRRMIHSPHLVQNVLI